MYNYLKTPIVVLLFSTTSAFSTPIAQDHALGASVVKGFEYGANCNQASPALSPDKQHRLNEFLLQHSLSTGRSMGLLGTARMGSSSDTLNLRQPCLLPRPS